MRRWPRAISTALRLRSNEAWLPAISILLDRRSSDTGFRRVIAGRDPKFVDRLASRCFALCFVWQRVPSFPSQVAQHRVAVNYRSFIGPNAQRADCSRCFSTKRDDETDARNTKGKSMVACLRFLSCLA